MDGAKRCQGQDPQAKNLYWLEDSSTQYNGGCWLAIKPSAQAWKELAPVRDWVNNFMGERFKTWKSYPAELSHITVFLGLNNKATPQEKEAVMRRVAAKLEQLPKFDLEIDFKTHDTNIHRGGNYAVLQFPTHSTVMINKLIRLAICQAVNARELDQTHLYKAEGSDKNGLEKEHHPHMTLGILEIPKEQHDKNNLHPELKEYWGGKRFGKLDEKFEEARKNHFSHVSVNIPVNEVNLLGGERTVANVSEKIHHTAAVVQLGQKTDKLVHIPYIGYYFPNMDFHMTEDEEIKFIMKAQNCTQKQAREYFNANKDQIYAALQQHDMSAKP